MREFKYQNESGTKTGKWYLNRLDYFEFHQFDGMAKYKTLSIIAMMFSLYWLKHSPWFLMFALVYVIYISLLSLVILYKQQCRWKGYFLYPSRFVEKLKLYRKDHELNDFDSLATMDKAGAGREINRHTSTRQHLRRND